MIIKRLIPLIAVLAISCSQQKHTEQTEVSHPEPTAEFLDSLKPAQEAMDTVVEEKKDDVEIAGRKFSSVQEIDKYISNSRHKEEYRNGIIPAIAKYSLDYASRLLSNKYDGFVIVDKSRMKVLYFDRYGREVLNYGMACAKNYGTKHQKADSRTPEGFFTASGIYDSTEWLFTDDNGKTSKKKGQFGPRFIRLNCPNTTQIGIHGTVAPWSIGSRASHGCIRVTNENIMELVQYVKVGMPVIVVPGKRDMAVNKSEGVDIPWIPTISGAKAPEVKNLPAKTDSIKSKTDSIPAVEKTVTDSVRHQEKELPAQNAEPGNAPETEPEHHKQVTPVNEPEKTEETKNAEG